MKKYIRSSKHTLKFSNNTKLLELILFINEYRRVTKLYLDYLWDKNFTISYPKNKQIETLYFDSNTKLDLPRFVSTVQINEEIGLDTMLSGRALTCCMTQVLGIARGTIEKQRKRQYVVNKLRSQSKKISRKLRKATRTNKPVKPDVGRVNPELNSSCIDFQESEDSSFDAFVQLKSFCKIRGKTINFPIKYHRQSNKWKEKGKRLNSFLVTEQNIQIRYKVENKQCEKKKSKVVGADQGLKDVVTLSDCQVTPKTNKDNQSLVNIVNKISRKKKGSKAFRKAKSHRKNFINYAINQLDFTDVKELRLEDIVNINYKRKGTPRYLSHWTNTLIRDKLERYCEEKEVLFTLQSSVYRSQRCSRCGLVRKSQRKSKVYSCKNCDLEIDADLNASLNHQQDLPDISYELRKLRKNLVGFFWRSDGFYELTGEEITVSLPRK